MTKRRQLSRRRARRQQQRDSRRVLVESLEARQMLAVIACNNGTNLGDLTLTEDTTIDNQSGTCLIGNVDMGNFSLIVDGDGDTTISGNLTGNAAAGNTLNNFDALGTGDFSFTADSQTFDARLDDDGTDSWLLVGRGRDGWEFDADGPGGALAAVNQNLGTPAAFTPAAYDDAIINGLLAQIGVDLTNVEIRLKRAANTAGTEYQEVRWNPTTQTTWTWDFDAGASGYAVSHEVGASVLGGAFTDATSQTRDTLSAGGGNNHERVFTWSWGGHGGRQGFSYGGSVQGTDNNSPTTFLWEIGNENHAIPYTEVYIRSTGARGAANHLIKEGIGSLTLQGSNTYTGETLIKAGTVVAAADMALGATTTNTQVHHGAVLELSGGVNLPEQLEVTGQGEGNGVIVSSSGSNAISGDVVVAGPRTSVTTAGAVTGGDPGEGLDMSGDFHYAVNALGVGGMQVGDALFTNQAGEPNVTITSNQAAANWDNASDFGSSANDAALNTIMRDIRWSSNPTPLGITLNGLTIGTKYKFQGLFQERCCNRGWDVIVDGQKVLQDFSPNAIQGGDYVNTGAVLTHEFTASAESVQITFDGTATAFPDKNPILMGLTVEDLGESSIVLFAADNGADLEISGNVDLGTSDLVVGGAGSTTIAGDIAGAVTGNNLSSLESLHSGEHSFTGDAQTFDGLIDNDGLHSWLLVGRGREGWEFDADGQGTLADVTQDLGTPNAFAPAAYSNAIINDLITQAGIDLTDVEIRLKRAANTSGTAYQEVRWKPLTQPTWTWAFDPGYAVALDVQPSVLGAAFSDPTSETRDGFSSGAGNNYQRVFTWAWGGHNNQRGFSYGGSVAGTDNNNPSTFLWEFTTENHAMPYTEVYVRSLGTQRGTNRVTKVDDGTLTLSGDNSYRGLTEVQEGILVAASDNALGDVDANTTVFDGATLELAGNTSIPEPLTVTGAGVAGTGAILSSSGNNTLTGTITALSPQPMATTSRGAVTGGDPGEGLDMEGNFLYAVNALGAGGQQVGDALFTDQAGEPNVVISANANAANWVTSTYDLGTSANDTALESVLRDIRYSVAPQVVSIDIQGLTIGNQYKFQGLFQERCCDRGWDVLVDGQLVSEDFSPLAIQGGDQNNTAAVLTHEFTAASTSVNIVFDGNPTAFPDKNPILMGLTVEQLGPFQRDLVIGSDGGTLNINGDIELQDNVGLELTGSADTIVNGIISTPAPTLNNIGGLGAGEFSFTADSQTFDALVDDDGEAAWLLIGRGRNGWQFDADGPGGSLAAVTQGLGTPAAFTPTAYSDAIINDLLAQAGLDLTDVEIRLKRAADTTGDSYQEVRWNPITQSFWTWDFDAGSNGYAVTHEVRPSALGGAFTDLTSETRDTNAAGSANNHERVFTWSWGGHGNQQGFSYGQTVVGTDGNDPNTFLWEIGTENHPLPYTEVYIRARDALAIPVSLSKTGSGTATLAGNNTYLLPTDVIEGTLVAASDNALGSTYADTTVRAGGTLALPGGVDLPENILVNGTGNAGAGAIVNTAGTNTLSGEVSLIGAPLPGSATTAGVVTGGDPGEGLDMDGNFLYAVNALGAGGQQVGDALFTDEAGEPNVVITANANVANWDNASNFGSSANDVALNSIMRDIRYSVAPQVVSIDINGLTVGNQYKFQGLFQERCCARGWDVIVDGNLVLEDFSPNLIQSGDYVNTGAVLTHEFTATSSSVNIVFNGNPTTFADKNPILMGLTVEDQGATQRPVSIGSAAGELIVNGELKLVDADAEITGAGDVTVNGTITSPAPSLSNLSALATGNYSFTADSQTFEALVDNDGTDTWLLIGRGRNGWEFDADGPASVPDEVNDGLGTSAAFVPKAFDSAIINDLLATAGLDMSDVEVRLRRAGDSAGTGDYQEVRWRDFTGNGNQWTWDFDGTPYGVTMQHLNVVAGLPGSQAYTTTGGNTDDFYGLGSGRNDATRVFTFAWSGHGDQQGFSYGLTVGGVNNNDPNTFLWEIGNEDHAIPYTEVYLRSRTSPTQLPDNLLKTGAGTLTLNSANTYNGLTEIEGGTVVVTDEGALGNPNVGTTVDGGTLALSGGINLSAEDVTITGTGAATQPGALVGISGNNEFSGQLSVTGTTAGVGSVDDPGTGFVDTLTISSSIDLQAGLVVDGDGDTVVTGNIIETLGVHQLEALGAGEFAFTAAGQDFLGTVDNDGTNSWLLVGRGREGWQFDADGQGNIADVNQNLGTSAAFAPAAYSEAIVNELIARAGIDMSDIEIRLSRAADTSGINQYQEGRFRNLATSDWRWDFDAGTGAGALTGTWEITNNVLGGPYLDTTTGTRDTFENPPNNNDGRRVFTWAWSGHGDVRGFSYGSSVNGVANNDPNTFLWEIANENHAIPYTEVYIRSLGTQAPVNGITKLGAGTLTVTGNNTYNGDTIVSEGVLVANTSGPNSATGGGNVVVQNGGSLAGAGNVSGAVTAASGGTVAPGDTVGAISTGDLTLQAGANYEFELASDTLHDTTNVSGSVDVTGANLVGSDTSASGVTGTFVIINNDGTDPVVGEFAGVPQATAVTIGAQSFFIDYQYDSGTSTPAAGNDIALVSNSAPDAVDDPNETTDEASAMNIDVMDNDSDPDEAIGDTIFLQGVSTLGTLGSVTVNDGTTPADASDDTVDYDPNGQFEYLGVGDSATDTFTYTISDRGGLTDMATVTVTISGLNDPPVLSVPGPQTVAEGALLDLSGLVSFTDLDLTDSHTITIDWGDGSAVENGSVTETMGSAPANPDTFALTNSHTFADDGSYTVTVTVDDGEALGSVTETISVTVTNALPALTLAAAAQNEGTAFAITDLGVITDAGFRNPANPNGASDETFTYSIDWGDFSAAATGMATIDDIGGMGDLTDASFDGSHSYDNNGVYTVTVRVADDDMTGDFTGGDDGVDFVEQTISLTVNNLPPTGTISGPTDALPSQTLTFTFSGDDPSPVDDTNLSCSVNWGDGNSDALGNCFTPVVLDHEYNGLGIFTVSLTITDDTVTQLVDTHTVNVTNNPRVDGQGNLLVPDSLMGSNEIVITDSTGGGQFVLRNDIGYGPFYPTTGKVIIITGDGPDRISIASRRICGDIDAGGGNNYISGSGCNDNIVTTAGDDIIIGGGGDDVIDAGDGNNKVDGGEGNDVITAGSGRDELLGRAGDDVINAGGGNDLVAGDTGDDLLRGGGGNDTLSGGGGNDIVLGEAGDDRLFGRLGRDILIGGFGGDDVQGNDGDDVLGGGDLAMSDSQLTAIRDEWTSSNDFLTRVNNVLTGAGAAAGNRLDSLTDDGSLDGLSGRIGNDLYVTHGPDAEFAVRGDDEVFTLS